MQTLLSTQQPTETYRNQFEHSNQLSSREFPQQQEEEEEQESSASSHPSPAAGSRAAKAVTPATVIAWLREHYKLGKHGYSKKAAVFAHYQALCAERGADSSISSTFFGKLVKRAFPEIKTIRKGPRGKVEQCYDRLKPVDPAKASRARWLERVNLYLAALQASAPQLQLQQQQPPVAQAATSAPAPAVRAQSDHHHHRPHQAQQQHQQQLQHQLPPRASHPTHHQAQQQSHYYALEGVTGHHHHYHFASSLDGGGHFLASLLPSFDSPSPSSSFASSPAAPSSPAAELAQTTPHHHHHHGTHDYAQLQLQQQQPYRGYESFEPVQPAASAYDVAARQDNSSWPQPQQQGGAPGLSRSAYMSTGYHRHLQQEVAARPYMALLAQEPSPLCEDHHDHTPFALYL